jgi:hypothetical protein
MKDRDALEAELPTLTASLDLTESKVSDVSKEVSNLKQYAKVMELTRDIATNLINAIHISEPVKNTSTLPLNSNGSIFFGVSLK